MLISTREFSEESVMKIKNRILPGICEKSLKKAHEL